MICSRKAKFLYSKILMLVFDDDRLFFVRNIVMKPGYYTECGKNRPYAGDYLGQPAATRWKVVGFECQKDGGPYHWFHQYYRSLGSFVQFCFHIIIS